MNSNYDELIFDNGFKLIEFYRENPIIALKDLLGVDLDTVQRCIFRDMWFKQYCLLVQGRGTGKSVSTDTISIIEGKGICYLNEVLPSIPTYLNDGTTEEIPFNERLYTSVGFRSTKQLSLEKNINGRMIRTQNGFELRCGETHPLLTINKDGDFIYKQVEGFLVGESICIQKNQKVFGDNSISKEEIDVIINNMYNNIDYDNNSYKIRTSDEVSQLYFIQRFTSCYITCGTKSILVSENYKLLKEFQLILLNFGIVAYIDGIVLNTYDVDLLRDLYNGVVCKNGHSYYVDEIVSNEAWSGDCYDFEMDMSPSLNEEPNYFANGFISHNTFLLGAMATLTALLYPGQRIGIMSGASFRQAKMVFAEVERLYNASSILQQACAKRPIHGSDSHYLEFKNVRGVGSVIQALPVGDSGSTIRGSRFYLILMDELAQVDSKVLDLVIRPMAATARNPMERVREIERRKRLVAAGMATEDEFSEFEVNRLIMASSGYFKFNHMWKRMCDYWDQIDKAIENNEEPRHAVWQVPYYDMSDGFLDVDGVNEALRNMSDLEFRMEYMAEMIRDSEGFFKASILEECSKEDFYIELSGNQACQYVIGIDPNQGGKADCGIVVLKISNEDYRVVYAETINSVAHKNISRAIKKLCRNFNVVGVFVDRGGGGTSVAERLAEDDDMPVLLTIGEETHEGKEGNFIVNLINFSTSWITDANFNLLAMLESKKILFPKPPTANSSDLYGEVYDNIMKMKMQMLNIVVTQNNSGTLHFDTPKKGQKKDLYSSLLLASYGAYIMQKEASMNNQQILYSSAGYIRPHTVENWSPIGGTFGDGFFSEKFSGALLKPKQKKK